MSRFTASELEALYRAIRERRDMRHFRSHPVNPAVLARLLAAAHQTPSVGLVQPSRFIRITDPDRRRDTTPWRKRNVYAPARGPVDAGVSS